MLKLFLLIYADDIAIFADSKESLQIGLDLLKSYCDRWKLKVNVNKTKVMIFHRGGNPYPNTMFMYGENEVEIVRKFTYLGIVFSPGGSFIETTKALSGQALKAIYKLQSYLYKFTDISVAHRLELFDKLILPILNYGSEIWGYNRSNVVERIHLAFCKNALGVRKSTQNNLVYGELGRTPLIYKRYVSIIRYWLKIIHCENTKYIKLMYKVMHK